MVKMVAAGDRTSDVYVKDNAASAFRFCAGKCFRWTIFGLIFLCVFIVALLGYLCVGDLCLAPDLQSHWIRLKSSENWKALNAGDPESKKHGVLQLADGRQEPLTRKTVTGQADKDFNVKFNMKASDVIVFLQIQNAGGNFFERHIIEDLDLETPCICRKRRKICHCNRPNKKSPWLFSRYTNGWKCGVHPDWTELTECVDKALDELEGRRLKRRYFFITLLRDPVTRFRSEWYHFKQARSWRSFRHRCGGREVTSEELPSCFDGKNQTSITLDEYLSCPHNLALNRQTRMLSDLGLVNCYNSTGMNKKDRSLIMLTSAKNNLHKMAFFGLAEYPKMSQCMFEATFNLTFRHREPQQRVRGFLRNGVRRSLLGDINEKHIEAIKKANSLDMEFYQYAKDLFNIRLEKLDNLKPGLKDYCGSENENVFSDNWADSEDLFDIL